MGRPRGRPTPEVQAPDVRIEWVRAEPSPPQAQAWRRLWRILLAPDDQAGEPAPSPTAVQAGDETCAEDDHEHDSLEDLSHER
jgi:hypothetical protein